MATPAGFLRLLPRLWSSHAATLTQVTGTLGSALSAVDRSTLEPSGWPTSEPTTSCGAEQSPQPWWRHNHDSNMLLGRRVDAARASQSAFPPTICVWDSRLVSFDVSKFLQAARQQQEDEQRQQPLMVQQVPLRRPEPLQELAAAVAVVEPTPLPAGAVPLEVPCVPCGPWDGSDSAPGPSPLQCGNRGNTYQPSRKKRVNRHGLQKRLGTPEGREVLLRRLRKGRWRVTVDAFR